MIYKNINDTKSNQSTFNAVSQSRRDTTCTRVRMFTFRVSAQFYRHFNSFMDIGERAPDSLHTHSHPSTNTRINTYIVHKHDLGQIKC